MASILLAGATGMVGALALERLLRDDRVGHVVAPTRRLLAPHPKLSNPLVDRLSLPHDADWWAVAGAICAIGTTREKTATAEEYRAIDHNYPLALAKRLRSSGAQRLAIVTSMGANARSWFRYTRTKGELEDAMGN